MNNQHVTPEYLEEQGKAHVQRAPQAFIDIDVEADGVAGHGSLLSIGAVSPWGETFYTELQPASDVFVPANKAFCEAHGLSRERLLAEGQAPEQALLDFAHWTNNVTTEHAKIQPVLSAYNASFDFGLLDAYYKQFGIENPYGHAAFCIKSLAMAISGGQGWDWSKTGKGSLPAQLVPAGEFTHHALDDAIYQQKIHFRLAGLLHLDHIFTE